MDHLVDDHADDDAAAADAAAAADDDDDHYYCHYILLWYNDLHEQQRLLKQIYNEFEQALTNQHKSAKVVAIWFVDDMLRFDYGFWLGFHGWAWGKAYPNCN